MGSPGGLGQKGQPLSSPAMHTCTWSGCVRSLWTGQRLDTMYSGFVCLLYVWHLQRSGVEEAGSGICRVVARRAQTWMSTFSGAR